jgi:hypothetical protein
MMSQKTGLQVYDGNNRALSVTINDTLDLILNSPLITQAFLRALSKVVVTIVGGTISEIVVNIDELAKRTSLELHSNKLVATFAKLDVTTRLCAKAVADAEMANYPPKFKEELVNRLTGLFYAEMSKLAPSGNMYK